MDCVLAVLDVALNMTAHVTWQRLPVQSDWPFLSRKRGDTCVSDGQHKTMQRLNLGPSAGAIFHLTYFMSLFVLLCTDHDSNVTKHTMR